MLGNKEKIEGVELKVVFTKMLVEIPWESLKAYVLANPQLMKLCTSGGFRLEERQRKRAEQFIMRDTEKGAFSEVMCNGIFALWYPVHKELHQNLEDYFHSDEYSKYREEKGLGEDEYVLNDEKFDAFYNVRDFEAWRILLCFSPLKFTAEQAAKIVEDKKTDTGVVERLAAVEAERNDLSKKMGQLTSEAERLRAKQQSDQSEILEQRKQLRQLRMDNEALQNRVDTAVAEMKRSNQQLAQASAAADQREEAVRIEMGRANQRLQNDVERLGKEVSNWQSRYEEQCAGNRALADKALEAERRCQEALAAKAVAENKISDSNKLVDSILNRIDWAHVGSSMKLSPTMKRNFASLLKQLNYDEDRNLTVADTLGNFWGNLLNTEKSLIDAIAQSTERELINGSIKDYWKELEGQFEGVVTSMEARMTMLGMMKDIFFQSYTDEDLQQPTVTKPAKAEPKAKPPKDEVKPARKTAAKTTKTSTKKAASKEE